MREHVGQRKHAEQFSDSSFSRSIITREPRASAVCVPCVREMPTLYQFIPRIRWLACISKNCKHHNPALHNPATRRKIYIDLPF